LSQKEGATLSAEENVKYTVRGFFALKESIRAFVALEYKGYAL
jgi:hypothetical protein